MIFLYPYFLYLHKNLHRFKWDEVWIGSKFQGSAYFDGHTRENSRLGNSTGWWWYSSNCTHITVDVTHTSVPTHHRQSITAVRTHFTIKSIPPLPSTPTFICQQCTLYILVFCGQNHSGYQAHRDTASIAGARASLSVVGGVSLEDSVGGRWNVFGNVPGNRGALISGGGSGPVCGRIPGPPPTYHVNLMLNYDWTFEPVMHWFSTSDSNSLNLEPHEGG